MSHNPPPPNGTSDLSILQKFTTSYIAWHNALGHVPKLSRYTLGVKVDTLYTTTLEYILCAAYASRQQKGAILDTASVKLDLLKYFLQLLCQLKALNNTQYAATSVPLVEVGKMLGAWRKQFQKETPA